MGSHKEKIKKNKFSIMLLTMFIKIIINIKLAMPKSEQYETVTSCQLLVIVCIVTVNALSYSVFSVLKSSILSKFNGP